MADAQITLRKGEIRPLYGSATTDSTGATLSVVASPPPTVTLYDSTGTPVSGFDEILSTGYTSGSANTVEVYIELDTSALELGSYLLMFHFQALGSDTLTRTYEPTIALQIESPIAPDQFFSYDLTTPLGQVRLLIADTQPDVRVFQDAEILFFLENNGGVVPLAAAQAYEVWALDQSRVSKYRRAPDGTVISRWTAEDMLKHADRLRNAPLRTLQTGAISSTDQEYLSEFRPIWRDMIDPGVVE